MAVTKRKLSDDNLERFVCNANDIIYFRFILTASDLDDEAKAFKPEYTHQFFGDSENIFGYIGLRVDIMYSACRLTPFCSITYREKVKPTRTGGVEADDVFKIICDKQELEPTTQLESFTESLSKESSFKPLGELLSSFSMKNGDQESTYSIYRADCTTPGFREYHNRMQTLILWFIDAASFIDDEDEKWEYFILHQDVKVGDEEYHPFVGYATVYRYYAYPTKIRPRISQMLVLPPYQKKGLGTKLLEHICERYISDDDVLDITVEDPSEEFIRIRDFLDCQKCESRESFSKENLKNGYSIEMMEDAQKQFKINKKQSRRVYEILRLKNTNLNDVEEYKAYRLDVKNRLNIPFQREKLDMEKLQKNLTPEELKAALNPMRREQQIEQLEHMYAELEAKYQHTIERLLIGN